MRKTNKVLFCILFLLIAVTASVTYSRYVSSFNATIAINVREPRYNVVFNANAAAATGTMDAQPFTYGTSQSLTSNAFVNDGYAFGGWNTSPDGTGDSYQDGESVSTLTSTEGANFPLYAQWILNNNYLVTYNGLNLPGLPTEVAPGQTLQVDFSGYSIRIIKITMAGVQTSNYTFANSILTIPNATGDIEIMAIDVSNIEVVFDASNTTATLSYNNITTLTGFVSAGQVHAGNASDETIVGITVVFNYRIPKGNSKVMDCALIVDGNQVGNTQTVTFTKNQTTKTLSFTSLNIAPTSIIQLQYTVNNSNNDAITFNSQEISIDYAQ